MCLMVWKRTYVMTNQMPALLVQRAPWTRVAVMLLQSLYFSRPLSPPPPTFESYNPRRPFPRYIWSWSVEQNARDTQMTTRVTEGARRERHARENGLSRSSDFLAWKLKCWQARHVKRDLRVCLNNRGFPTALFKAHLMHCIELESILN